MIEAQVAKTILYNGFVRDKQNHLYIVVGASLHAQRALYEWYVSLHACTARDGDTVCGHCQACVQIAHHTYVNSIIVQRPTERKSIGLEAIADLQATFVTTSQLAGTRFFCIEEAETLTVQAMNSVLKFLEEPQGATIGFLFTTSETKLLATIRSRGQVLRLLPSVDRTQTVRVAKKLPDAFEQTAAQVLLSAGYEEKVVIKQVPALHALSLTFLRELAGGSAPIVAQIALENFVKKTKTTTMVLEFLLYLLESYIKDERALTVEPLLSQFLTTHAAAIYIAAYQAVDNKRYHVSMSTLLTDFSLRLTDSLSAASSNATGA
jgi:hypothetical protein